MHGMGLHDRNAFDEPILFWMFNLFQMAHFILPQGRVQGSANLRGPGSEKMRIKKLRSFACSRQENTISYTLILGTWAPWISRSLYVPQLKIWNRKKMLLTFFESACTNIQGPAKRLRPGMMNFVIAVSLPYLPELACSIVTTCPEPFGQEKRGFEAPGIFGP